jgi:hypothetical protein
LPKKANAISVLKGKAQVLQSPNYHSTLLIGAKLAACGNLE